MQSSTPMYAISSCVSMLIGAATLLSSWFDCAISGVLYSAITLGGELYDDVSLMFSKWHLSLILAVLRVHLAFLTILFGFIVLGRYVLPSMPDWMSSNIGRGSTFFDLLTIVAMLLLRPMERRRLRSLFETDVL
jgi:hypothetical protein